MISDITKQQRTTVVKIKGDSNPPTLPRPRCSGSVKSCEYGISTPPESLEPHSLPVHASSSHFGIYSPSSSGSRPTKSSAMGAIHRAHVRSSSPVRSRTPEPIPPPPPPLPAAQTQSSHVPIASHAELRKMETMVNNMKDHFRESRVTYVKRPKNMFLSQLYFLFHLAMTLCLLRYSGSSNHASGFRDTVSYYFGYLLGTSVVFVLVLRCWKSKNADPERDNVSLVYGSIALGLTQLIAIGLDFAECFKSQFMFLPILHFIFVFLLMHFMLANSRDGPQYNFNNIAISHLLATQISLWIINFCPDFGPCGYRNSGGRHFNHSRQHQDSTKRSFQSTFKDMLLPIIHHFQILVIFLLLSTWRNNNKDRSHYLTTRFNEATNNPIYSSTREKGSVKGFFLGILIISAAIIALLHGDNEVSLLTHIIIQGLSALASFLGLVLRGRKDRGLRKLPIKFYDPSEHDFVILATLLAAYFLSISTVLNNLPLPVMDANDLANGVFLIVQTTFQTFLVRYDGRNLEKMRDVFAFLILSNFSLWILEVTQIASTISRSPNFSLQMIPVMLVALNRFHSSLVFIHLWKTK